MTSLNARGRLQVHGEIPIVYGSNNEIDWIKNVDGDIITNDNIDSLIPQIDLDSAKNTVANIVDWNNEVKAGNKSWQDYFDTLGQGEQYIVDLIKNTDNLSKLTGDDLVQANQNARQAALAHNKALQQQTIGANAATLGLKALTIAGNMLLSMGISMAISAVIKGLDYLIHRQEKLKEALDESVNEFKAATDELKSLEEEFETTTKRIEELQKLADNGSISIAEEAELKTLKETNKELKRKVVLKQQEQAQEARDVLKDSKKNANSKVQSKYKGHSNSSGERFDYENITPDEELKAAIEAYSTYSKNAEKSDNPNVQKWYEDQADSAKNRIEEMYDLISPTIEAYEELIAAGIELKGEDKVRYEQLKAAQDSYAAYIYTLNGTKEAFEGLNAEQQRNIILNRLVKQGLSKDVAKAILGNISDEDLDKFWDKDFSFTPPEMKDGETAEEYGKRYAKAWLNGLKDGVSDAGDKTTSSLSDLEKVSDNIGKISTAYKELSDNGYITIKTINELKTATGLSGDEWAEYENKLLNAKAGSAEFNQVMSDLTYKMIENQVKTGDLTNATDEEIKAIENKIAAVLREKAHDTSIKIISLPIVSAKL